MIDAKDEAATAWYVSYGAVRLDDRHLSLVMTYVEFNKARAAAGPAPI